MVEGRWGGGGRGALFFACLPHGRGRIFGRVAWSGGWHGCCSLSTPPPPSPRRCLSSPISPHGFSFSRPLPRFFSPWLALRISRRLCQPHCTRRCSRGCPLSLSDKSFGPRSTAGLCQTFVSFSSFVVRRLGAPYPSDTPRPSLVESWSHRCRRFPAGRRPRGPPTCPPRGWATATRASSASLVGRESTKARRRRALLPRRHCPKSSRLRCHRRRSRHPSRP